MAENLKTIQELGDTTTTDTRGSAYSGYALEPVVWEKEITDAAKKRWYFTQFAYQTTLDKGQKDIIVPIRSLYGGITWQASQAEGAAVSYSDLNNLDGVTFTPADENYGIAISNRALRVNAVDLLRAAKDELIYHCGDVVDAAVAVAVGNATAATSSARGAQTIYGGDARSDAELVAGDKFTVDMIADAKTKLQSTTCKYWTPSSPAAEGTSSAAKNPWMSTPDEPFVLFIAPEQENVIIKDSQFVNAAEYGSNKVIMNGEIGEYLGVKVVVSPNVEAVAASGTAPDGTGTVTPAMHRCLMVKARKAYGIAWGQKPKLQVFDFPSELEMRLVIEQAYHTKSIHNDAVVFIDVSDA